MLAYLAVCLTYLGYIDQARSRMNEALSEARRLGHAYTLAFVLLQAAWMESIAYCPELEQHTKEVLALSTEHGFGSHFVWGTRYHGHSLTMRGQPEEGLALLVLQPGLSVTSAGR